MKNIITLFFLMGSTAVSFAQANRTYTNVLVNTPMTFFSDVTSCSGSGCFSCSSYSSTRTQYGLKDGSALTVWQSGDPFPGGFATYTRSYPTGTSTISHRTRTVNQSLGCNYSYGTETSYGTITITTVPLISWSPTPPSELCIGNSLNLASYVNVPNNEFLKFYVNGSQIASSTWTPIAPGTYSVQGLFSYFQGERTTSTVNITVYSLVSVLNSPSSSGICLGGNATFSVVATGAGLNYSWQESVNNGASWSSLVNGGVYSGVTTSTLTLSSPSTNFHGRRYRVVVGGLCNTETSSNALLSVTHPITFTSNNMPSTVNVCPGGSLNFNVAATTPVGSGGIQYKFQYKYPSGDWVDWTSSSTLSVTVPNNQDWQDLQVRALAFDNCGAATQAITPVTTINVFDQVTITTQPGNRNVCPGSGTSFSLNAVPSSGSLSYQWQQSTNGGSSWSVVSDGGIFSGATTSALSLSSVTQPMNGTLYRCVVSDACGSVNQRTSNVATLTVYQTLQVSSQPPSRSVCPGTNTTFPVVVNQQNGTPNYQWQVSTNGGSSWADLGNSGIYSGVTTSTLTVTGVTSSVNNSQFRVRISDACGSVTQNTSSPATLTVFAPAISSHPSNASSCIGSTTSFSATAVVQTGSASFQWQISTNGGSSWSNLTASSTYTGVNAATLSVSSVSSSLNGARYRAIVWDGCGPSNSVASNSATLTVFNPVSITAQPPNRSICPGTSTTFTVSATAGNGALTYQWQLSTNGGTTFTNVSNGGIYSGATTATLTLTNAPESVNGYRYRVLVADACGTATQATSSAGSLTIFKPVISAQPQNTSSCIASSATFTTTASVQTGSAAYQWQVSTNGGTSWTDISNNSTYSGATTATLTVASLTTSLNNSQYRVRVWDGCGTSNSVTSSGATLTVFNPVAITTHPPARSICPGTNTTFVVSAIAGNGSLSYQWQISTNGGSSWANVTNSGIYSGATTSTLTLTNATDATNGYRYRAIVGDGCGASTQATSNAGLLTIIKPVITVQPQNASTCPGTSTSFSTGATVQSGTATYQWQVSSNGGTSWTDLTTTATYSGVTAATLSVNSPSSALNSYRYRAKIWDGCGTSNAVTTNAATLSVLNSISIPTQPADKLVCNNGGTTITVVASGSSLTYQWQVSTNGGSSWSNISNGGVYSGATTETLVLVNVTAALNNNRYRVAINSACSNTTSNSATLTLQNAPVITTEPADATSCAGTNASFTVAGSGNGLTYQWQFNGSGTWGDISGATGATFTRTNVTSGHAGRYRATVSNGCGSTTSLPATLTVNPITSVATQPTNMAGCAGSATSLSVTAGGTGPFTYDWQKETTPGNFQSVGATTATYTIASLQSANSGNYRVRVTGGCGVAVISEIVALTVNAIPPRPSAEDVARCGDGPLTGVATSTSAGATFRWYLNEADVTPLFQGASYQVSNLTTTQNFFVSQSVSGCEGAKEPITFTHHELEPAPIGGTLSLCIAQGIHNLENDITDPVAKGGVFSWVANSINFTGNSFNPNVGNGTYVVSYIPPTAAQGVPHCYIPATRTINVLSDGGDGGIVFDPNFVSVANTINSCVGDEPFSVTALVNVPGGNWSTVQGSGLSFNGSNAVFTPDQTSFTPSSPNVFRYTVAVGGCTSSKDLNVFVKDNTAKPIVTGLPAIVCPGTQISLNATVAQPGTFSYRWSKPGNSTPVATTATLSYAVTIGETLEVRSINSSFGCASEATLVNIVTPFTGGEISVDKGVINAGEKIRFTTNAPESGNTFRWDFGDGFISNEKNPTHYYYSIGEYVVKLLITSSLNCSSTLEFDKIIVGGTPIEVITDVPFQNVEGIVLAPNPVDSDLSIKSGIRIVSVYVRDVQGKLIDTPITPLTAYEYSINMGATAQGIYLITVRTVNGIQIHKIFRK